MQSTIENTHRRPRLTFFVEGDTIGELRAKVIQALDLQLGLKAEQAAAHVEALQAEDTTTAEIPESAEKAVTESTAAPVEKVTLGRKPRAKKAAEPVQEEAKTTVVSDFAKEIEAQADAEDAPKKLTGEAVKAAFDQYVNRFGVAAAQEDGPQLLDRVFGVGVIRRVRDVPTDDQGKLGRIIAAVEGAILTNEFKRSAVQ